MPSLPVNRETDPDLPHCSGMNRARGSHNVFTNNLPTAREGVDPNEPHLKPGGDKCFIHQAVVSKGSRTVFVNGIPVARETDPLAGCTSVMKGSPDVYAGG